MDAHELLIVLAIICFVVAALIDLVPLPGRGGGVFLPVGAGAVRGVVPLSGRGRLAPCCC